MKSLLLLCLALVSVRAFAAERGIVETTNAKNRILLVGVPHGLPGIDKDLRMVESISSHVAYQFAATKLWSAEGSVSKIAQNLQTLSADAAEQGTFFFYFSGHGSPGSIYVKDRSMRIAEIRAAIEQGRANLGPLARLVLMFDSCYSGSLVDPVKKTFAPVVDRAQSESFADEVMAEFSRGNRADYWKSLFVFASSRANETSGAGSQGSTFTVALKKAFDEVMGANGTMAEWVQKTKSYTHGHHPVERFSPLDVAHEKMAP